MIGFVTILVALVTGPHPVELAVGQNVATVELRLDGRTTSVLSAPPWRVVVDFGSRIEPHELVAVALDDDGGEIGRCRQLVNLPRPPIEGELVVERDEGGTPRRARLAVGTATGLGPSLVRVTLDGRELSLLRGSDWYDLPDMSRSGPHLLTAQMWLPDGETARVDLALGGGWGGQATTELTAVPVVLDTGSAPLTIARAPRIRAGGVPLQVAAVERAGARVLLVRDRRSLPLLRELAARQERLDRVRPRSDELLQPVDLEPDRDGLQLVVPLPTRLGQGHMPVDLFPVLGWYRLQPGLLPWVVTHLESVDRDGQRLADAVAVAGVRAAGGGSPRAVVLLVDGTPEDASGQLPEAVRRYLELLRVPLRVWSTDGTQREVDGWGSAEDVSSRRKLRRAAERLEELLARQWIVWVQGRHLPASLQLARGPGGDSTAQVAPSLRGAKRRSNPLRGGSAPCCLVCGRRQRCSARPAAAENFFSFAAHQVGLADVILPEAVVEGADRDPEEPGGPLAVPFRLLERGEDGSPLAVPQRQRWLGRRWGRGLSAEVREVLGPDLGTGGDDQRPLQHVAQLADVAGPVVAREEPAGSARTPASGLPRAWRRQLVDQSRDQELQVAGPLAQRRQVEADHGEAVVEVARGTVPPPRRPRGRGWWRPPGARRPAPVSRPPTRSHHPLLEDPQQLGLERLRQLAHLVEEQRAAGRLLEPARSARRRRR